MNITLTWWHISLLVVGGFTIAGMVFAMTRRNDSSGGFTDFDARPLGCGCALLAGVFVSAIIMAVWGWTR